MVPWRYVHSWNCIACGLCCKSFDVVLSFPEWVNLIKIYGVEVTKPGIDKIYLKRRSDGSCVFLQNFFGRWICGLQHMKPLACKLWPFKILSRPKYGRAEEALYKYKGHKLFIYVDPFCVGIKWGKPTFEFVSKTLNEFIELALGLRTKQVYSTANLKPLAVRWKPRRLI